MSKTKHQLRGRIIMTSLFDLTGKTAIVTGSSRGIGKAIVEQLAAHGCNVVVSSRKAGPCEEVAAAINATHGDNRAVAIPANIGVKEDLQRLVDQTKVKFGQIDIVICNAASNPYFGPMADITDEAFTKILQNNIISNHWLIAMCAPEMRARKSGSVIIVSSIGGLKATDVIGAYNISKAADMQLARNLALEFGRDEVTVNCIAPGLIQTDFAKALWDNPDILKASTARQCVKRIGQPDEIAGMAVFLASKAGAFTTGQTMVIDGGATAV
jgi:NAD(P)-dependent dehydrogenase (short-subunit alcohol dehydrogenase family)